MKILIFGSKGFLGTKLMNVLSKKHEVIGIDKKTVDGTGLDATNSSEVSKVFEEHKPDIAIDTIALTSSVACEKNPELAEKLNFLTAKNIVKECERHNVKMIFISSSYVFDGEEGNYSEEDTIKPINVYGKTKILAEKEISKIKDYLILRVDMLYGYNDENSPNGLIGKLISEDNIQVGNANQIRSPLFIEDLANIIEKLIKEDITGLFHVSGSEKLKHIDILNLIKDKLGTKNKIELLDDKNLMVKSFKDSSLDNNKIKKIYTNLKSINETLDKIKELL